MTLIRLIQAASILAGVTVAGLSFQNNPVHADTPTPQFCVIASNGKTACGTLKEVERACVTTDDNKTVCGKYKSVRGEQAQEPRQEEARNPTSSAGYRKESGAVSYLLRSCKRSDSGVKCIFVITTKKENQLVNIVAGKGYSSIVDSAGRTYPSSNFEYNGSNRNQFQVNSSPGVDYVVDLNFENIPGQITKAALVNINEFGGKVVQFRNVPISN
jgi:hypothetical protein